MKKNWKLALLPVALFLAACGGEPEEANTKPTEMLKQEATVAPEPTEQPVDTEESVTPMQLLTSTETLQEWSNGRLICNVAWQEFSLSEEDALRYPELAKVLEERNLDGRTAGEASFAELLPIARELEKDTEFLWNCMDVNSMYVQRADNVIFSVRKDCIFDAGSIHPMSGVTSFNLSPETGEEMTLADVVADVPKTIEEVKRLLEEEYADCLFDEWKEILATYGEETYVWTLDYQGITFYFSPYEISPYVAGLLTVSIGFDEMSELFFEEYKESTKAGYAKGIPFGSLIEIKRDGIKEYFAIHQTQMQEGDDHLKLELLYDGKSVIAEEIYAYDYTAHLVSPDAAKYYLYVDARYENDAHTLYVFDLNGASAGTLLTALGGGFSTVYDADGKGLAEVFTNPSEFSLEFRMDMMRTNVGTMSYHVENATGMPIPKSEYYALDTEQEPLTAKVPVEVTILSDGSTETVAVGTTFYFLRTDNVTYIDFKLSDGRECRIEVNTTEWPHTINGVPEEECFEGIGYAG